MGGEVVIIKLCSQAIYRKGTSIGTDGRGPVEIPSEEARLYITERWCKRRGF